MGKQKKKNHEIREEEENEKKSVEGSGGGGNSFLGWVVVLIRLALCLWFLSMAVDIRLEAVRNYGRVIHEFDPWFNYRATEYLVEHGYSQFVDWFDYGSWYPIGRPVGKTVHPGLMITSSLIYHSLNAIGYEISLNDVCVFIPAIFSVVSCSFLYLLAYEISLNHNVATAALGVFAILPAHLMRSVAGGYDNESVAVSFIISTFYFWTCSLRRPSVVSGVATGLSYVCMVATWGAYTFVLNMIAGSCALVLFIGRFSWGLYFSYSAFFIVGTFGALQFPIVGWQPFDSMEQVSALAVFGLIQVFAVAEYLRLTFRPSSRTFFLLVSVFVLLISVALGYKMIEWIDSGKLLPVTARIRSLFVEHTKTGNPLVDSVAEHQSTDIQVYMVYFNLAGAAAVGGLLLSVIALFPWTNSALFFYMLFFISGYFSMKMVRLILLLAPPAAVGAGMFIGWLLQWGVSVVCFCDGVSWFSSSSSSSSCSSSSSSGDSGSSPSSLSSKKKKKKKKGFIARWKNYFGGKIEGLYQYKLLLAIRYLIAIAIIGGVIYGSYMFYVHSFSIAPHMSEPQILMRSSDRKGNVVIVRDIMDAYLWLKENTPEDSRVLAWWDYGYQISGVSNRTTIADGNTWNHEHIALLGRCLISPERKAHRIIRHLADYVLVWTSSWAGVYGDDLAKCPHMARIASSVFFDIQHQDYYMMGPNQPSKTLSNSLLYQLHSYRLNPYVQPLKHFEEVFSSQNNMVRIYKVKNVAQDSKNFCEEHHTYPPALNEILAKSNRFERSREQQYLDLYQTNK